MALLKGLAGSAARLSEPTPLETLTTTGAADFSSNGMLIARFVGLSVPVIGAGIALDRGASAPNTVLGFAILVGLGVAGAGWGLLARKPKNSPQIA